LKKTYKGIAQGNIIVLQEPLDLPDRSEVMVTVTPRKKEIRKAFGVWKDRTDLDKLTKEIYENRKRNLGREVKHFSQVEGLKLEDWLSS
jgi:Zn-finger nucleic acid-binding protein